METFDEWLQRTGQHTKNVDAIELAKIAWSTALAQSRNYVADEEQMPDSVTFANGRIVRIVDNKTPGVHNGVYLEVEG